ncbi:hypothetical protein OU798_20135 [Prolixibacteraceae bacterium Z1-6]|uniref:Bacteriocin n=1 Tax=Draconibacterium aestuarii TaxID=2998507 RepID=A0A9X3J9D6_9BACT|nr:hypothetical protein [Prolixibacteraceae bacterium Z1-6]
MKELSFEKMEDIQGGADWSCNMGMTVVGAFWAGMAGIATGGVGAFVFAVGWGALQTYVCG